MYRRERELTPYTKNGIDPLLTILTVLVAFLGAGAVWDAAFAAGMMKGQGAFPMEFVKHCVGLLIGGIAYFVVSAIPITKLKRMTPWFYWIIFLACILVLIPGLGQVAWGARRRLGGEALGFQPAELLKPGTVVFLALCACRKLPAYRRRGFVAWLDNLVPRAWPILVVGISFVLVELEPDLGTALVILMITFGMLLFGLGRNLYGKYNIRILSVFVCLAIAAISFLALSKGYRVERIENHAKRWQPGIVDGPGFQTTVAEKAMAVGGPVGVGVGKGMAKHVLPAATTDFICVTIFEEFGVIGSFTVILLLGGITFRLMYLATFVKDSYGRLILQGTGWWIGSQSIFNLLVAGSAIPTVGIPLPFFSYGNSSLLALGIALGACRSAMSTRRLAEAAREDSSDGRRYGRPRLSGA